MLSSNQNPVENQQSILNQDAPCRAFFSSIPTAQMIQYNQSKPRSVNMNYNVLIVDDEQALSESTCEYLNMFDVKTAWVATPAASLEFFQNNTADLILLDINLGDESGFELCKKLRQTIDVPILFISARTSDDDVLLALNIGGDDYIRKP